MECTKCHAVNKVASTHCEKCGAPLRFWRRSGRFRVKMVFFFMALLLAWAAGSAYFSRNTVPPDYSAEETGTIDESKSENRKRIKGRGHTSFRGSAVQGVGEDGRKEIAARADNIVPDEGQSVKEIAAGWVVMSDPWGRQVRKFRAGLAGAGWLALPSRACLGGKRWYFDRDFGGRAEISGGLWINGDKAGVWKIDENSGSFDGPGLAAWNAGEPVSWLSLESASEHHSLQLSSLRTEGFFISSSLPDYINEAGVFIQGGSVVGWSFGQWLSTGYMWAGTDLHQKTRVSDFYNATFAGGREEKFTMALSMKKSHPALNQLATFFDGFRLNPRLAIEDTPYYLLPEEVVKQVRTLISSAVQQGEGSQVVNQLNSQMLKRIGDLPLLMDVVPVIVTARGYDAAIGEIEDSGRYIVEQQGGDVLAIDKLHVHLYQQWLQSLVSAGAVDEGWQAYGSAKGYFPDDPYIHLLGVELELLNGDWEAAERQLTMRDYPLAFRDRSELLAQRIAEMKGQAGKIVIRFPHGSNRISVTAAINGTLFQDFLVDTGASMVMIPLSVADALGLESLGKRRVSTVGGVVTADEVVIEEIEIEGWVEYNVRALAYEISDRPTLGLLGLNFLGRFQMDLNTNEGTLLLTPR